MIFLRKRGQGFREILILGCGLFFVWGEHLFLEIEWGSVAEAAVTAAAVVEGFDIIEGHQLSGGAGGWDGVTEALGFQRGDEALGEGVVVDWRCGSCSG